MPVEWKRKKLSRTITTLSKIFGIAALLLILELHSNYFAEQMNLVKKTDIPEIFCSWKFVPLHWLKKLKNQGQELVSHPMQNFNTFNDNHNFRIVQINVYHQYMLHHAPRLRNFERPFTKSAKSIAQGLFEYYKQNQLGTKKQKGTCNVSYLLCLVNKTGNII